MWEDDRVMSPRISRYLHENPGADFIAAFIITLIIVALIYPFAADIANELTNFAFFSLVAGVILQTLTLRRNKKRTL